MTFFEEEDKAKVERSEKWEHYISQFLPFFLQSIGVKDVKQEDCLLHFKSVEESHKPAQKKVEEPVTKEQRIEEANNFWNAFFAAHAPNNDLGVVKSRRKKRKRKKELSDA